MGKGAASRERGPPAEDALAAAIEEYRPLLRRAFDEGEKAYGPLSLPYEAFARRVLEHMPGPALGRSIPEGLFLAIACEERVPGAWETLIQRFVPRLRGLLLHGGASYSEAEEIVQDLPGKLFAPPAGGGPRTRMGSYAGRASLFAWLSAIVLRSLVDRRRERRTASLAGGRGEGTPPSDQRPDPEARAPDPAEALLDGETTARLEEALRAAWKDLSHREALVLLSKYREGIPQKEIARMLGVGEPRVCRILDAALARIRESVNARFPEEEWEDRAGLWKALGDAVARHLARSGPGAVLPTEGGPST